MNPSELVYIYYILGMYTRLLFFANISQGVATYYVHPSYRILTAFLEF